jgi:serine/threonine-protein kinase RsbW
MVANHHTRSIPTAADFCTPDCRNLSVHLTSEVGPLTEQFATDLAAAGFTDKEIFGMRMAVEEAVVNGIKHGNQCDPGKQVRFFYRISPKEVVLLVEDEGPGFKPEGVPDPLARENLEKPGGRGVFLMRAYMTWVKFNDRGNSVVMCKVK